MNFPKLTMTSTNAVINIQSTSARLDYRTTAPQVELKQEQALTKLETTAPKIIIDQSQCFAEEGLKNNEALTAENTNYSIQKMYESMGRIVDQGNQLADIGRSADGAISSQAEYNAYTQFEHDFNYGTIPMSRPRIDVIRGEIKVSAEGGKVYVNPKLGSIDFNYTSGKVEIYLAQKNSLTIQVEGLNVDLKV